MSIYSQLPNDIIIRIIKEADGGLYTHKKKLQHLLRRELNPPHNADHIYGCPFLFTDCNERANDENMWYISTLSGGYLYVPIPPIDPREFTSLDETMYEKNKSIASQMSFPENADASWMYSLVK
jgi:hypothetical protein